MLTGEATGRDPILYGPGVEIEADGVQHLVIRMRCNTADFAQLFWSTATSSQSQGNSVRFPVIGDGKFHDYEVDMSQSPQWRGLITSLRFDPLTKQGAKFSVDFIQFR